MTLPGVLSDHGSFSKVLMARSLHSELARSLQNTASAPQTMRDWLGEQHSRDELFKSRQLARSHPVGSLARSADLIIRDEIERIVAQEEA